MRSLIISILLAIQCLPVPAYDPKLAQTIVDFAGAAYFCRSLACELWICTSCSRHPNTVVKRLYDKNHNGNGFIGYDSDLDIIIISFAGTDTQSIPNWIDDLDAVLRDYPDDGCDACKVHLGFYNTYKALQDQLLVDLETLRTDHPQVPIWVTGHSLGAALACLCVLDLMGRGHPVKVSYNFGQPRLGNRPLAYHYTDRMQTFGIDHYRLTHDHDPVPHLPPESFGFWQEPYEVFYSKDMSTYLVCDATGEDKACSDQYLVLTSVSDHLHYLGVSFGSEELEGMQAEVMMEMAMLMDGQMTSTASAAPLVTIEAAKGGEAVTASQQQKRIDVVMGSGAAPIVRAAATADGEGEEEEELSQQPHQQQQQERMEGLSDSSSSIATNRIRGRRDM